VAVHKKQVVPHRLRQRLWVSYPSPAGVGERLWNSTHRPSEVYARRSVKLNRLSGRHCSPGHRVLIFASPNTKNGNFGQFDPCVSVNVISVEDKADSA